jgi:hypothetical protein
MSQLKYWKQEATAMRIYDSDKNLLSGAKLERAKGGETNSIIGILPNSEPQHKTALLFTLLKCRIP